MQASTPAQTGNRNEKAGESQFMHTFAWPAGGLSVQSTFVLLGYAINFNANTFEVNSSVCWFSVVLIFYFWNLNFNINIFFLVFI